MSDYAALPLLILATITHMEGGDESDCEALFAHVGGDKLPQSPSEAFAHVEDMRAFVRARVESRA